MTPSLFKKRLRDHGFTFLHNPGCGDRFTREVVGKKQHSARDSVRGSAWRLFLAVGEVPPIWPTSAVTPEEQPSWVESESPWFDYFTDLDPSDPLDAQFDSREVALEKCFNWLTTIGFEWLSDLAARTPEDWRKKYGITYVIG